MIFHSIATERQARRVLYVMEQLSCTVRSGGQVTERHLSILNQDVHQLLDDIGGFENVIRGYAEAGRM